MKTFLEYAYIMSSIAVIKAKIRLIKLCVKYDIELVYGSNYSRPVSYTCKGKKVNPKLLDLMQSISKDEYDLFKTLF